MTFPSIPEIRAARTRLGQRVVTTPVRELVDHALAERLAMGTRVWLKEELFQRTGSFKPRGALTVMLELSDEQLARGVTGVSAGNHAISLAYAARELKTTATVVMPRTASPFRIAMCRELGVRGMTTVAVVLSSRACATSKPPSNAPSCIRTRDPARHSVRPRWASSSWSNSPRRTSHPMP
jgi:threonine dehydratase